jgi:cytochrome d ubiquinol oxidase subunit I
VLISLVGFTAIYAVLAVVEIGLITKTAKKGPDPLPGPDDAHPGDLAVEDTPTTVY